jgi:putative Holliday junction resolvase
MTKTKAYMALDVGEKRIGVAIADSDVRIAVPLMTIEGAETDPYSEVRRLIGYHDINVLVVGYPRNQSGEATAQTAFVEDFVAQLGDIPAEIIYRDESLTSVLAEEYLRKTRKNYTKADIDMNAAAIILSDYIEDEAIS